MSSFSRKIKRNQKMNIENKIIQEAGCIGVTASKYVLRARQEGLATHCTITHIARNILGDQIIAEFANENMQPVFALFLRRSDCPVIDEHWGDEEWDSLIYQIIDLAANGRFVTTEMDGAA